MGGEEEHMIRMNYTTKGYKKIMREAVRSRTPEKEKVEINDCDYHMTEE